MCNPNFLEPGKDEWWASPRCIRWGSPRWRTRCPRWAVPAVVTAPSSGSPVSKAPVTAKGYYWLFGLVEKLINQTVPAFCITPHSPFLTAHGLFPQLFPVCRPKIFSQIPDGRHDLGSSLWAAFTGLPLPPPTCGEPQKIEVALTTSSSRSEAIMARKLADLGSTRLSRQTSVSSEDRPRGLSSLNSQTDRARATLARSLSFGQPGTIASSCRLSRLENGRRSASLVDRKVEERQKERDSVLQLLNLRLGGRPGQPGR